LAKQHINRCQEDSINTLQMKLKTQEIYGRAPYGFKNYRENNKPSILLLPFESGVVRRIFELYSSGSYSYLQISKKLKSELNYDIYKSKIEKILKNRFYIGFREFDGEIYPHKYGSLIEDKVWRICEDIRNGRGFNKRKGKLAGKNGIYRGLVACKQCGCSMTPELHTKTQKNGNNINGFIIIALEVRESILMFGLKKRNLQSNLH